MSTLTKGFRKVTSLLMAGLLSVSIFSVGATIQASAVTYSQMSALDQYAYSGNDLGAVYSKASTTFKVWAPTATKVQIKRYTTGSDTETGAAVIETKDMTKGSQGVWSITISGDLNGTYYTYLVTCDGKTKETVDIYARTTGVNGMRGMVLDLNSTDPAGWENDKRVSCPNQTDAIIWEAHVRDFSASPDSGMKNKGKYLAFTETGTTVNNDGQNPTGVDYLADLGITHVHLLPVYDYASVDETKLNTDQFNWGYDPMNYNTPEGSYSTDPYHGEVRVNEFKQMVQSLHNKGIGVVMDVVYNHTNYGGSGVNDWFDFTVPGYYYRQDAKGGYNNGSGCGNETASDRAMYQKFMIDSLTYWATEYHLDGFRFDLMGIHDVDTMNAIRQALDKISPDILIYGEPWTAAATTCPKATAVQGNMKLLSEEIAAFNDKSRDAIKGSCFNASDPGFIQGASWFEEALKGSIQANATTMSGDAKWSKQPSQTVTYTSAHDNYTLYDKLVKSVKGGAGYGNRYDDLVAMNKMAGGIILTSQGMSFFQAGEEFARTKYGDENSYKSPTATNQLVWTNTKTYSDLYAYYKGLIEIRKAYSPFRDPTNTSNSTIYFSWGDTLPGKVVAFTMYNKIAPDTEWNYVAVIHNANTTSQTVPLMTYTDKTLPNQWVIVADGSSAGVTSLGVSGSTVTVPPRSTMVLVDKPSFDKTVISTGGTVTVNHILKSSTTTYKTETLKGKEGTSYTTSPLAELTSQGYTVSSVSGDTTGVFTKAGTTVTYYYELDSTKYSTVTVKYQDAETGASIAPDDVKSGKIGDTYSVSPKTVKGYECDESLTSNANGKFAAGGTTVIFKYHETESDTLTIHYYNSSGWSQVAMYVYTESGTTATQLTGTWPGSVMKDEGSGWYVGTVDYDGAALFIANNYVSVNGAQDPSGYGSTGYAVSGEVWIKGGKIYQTGKVNVRYTAQDGTLLAKETLKGIADGTASYTTSAKSFEGYELVTTPTNATGLYTATEINVNYIYKSTAVSDPLKNTSAFAADKIKLGQPITLNCSATGGTAPYEYEIYMGPERMRSYKADPTMTITPQNGGTYTFTVNVKDSSGTVASKTLTCTVDSSDSEITLNAEISSTAIALGENVKLYARAFGGTAPYQFAFYYKKSTSSNYTTAQAYSTNNNAAITPATAVSYDVRVKVKDSTGKTAVKDFTVTVSSELKNTSTLSANVVALGSSVTVNASAAGGTAPYQYAVYYKKTAATTYSAVRTYSTAKTINVTPAAITTYDIRVKVKDSKNKVVNKDFTVTVIDGALKNNSTLSAYNITLGGSVTVTAKALGGTAPYRYAVYYKKSTSSTYSAVQTYSTKKSITVTPATATTYDIRVKVKDSKNKVVNKDFTVTVKKAGTTPLANTSTLSAYSITLGDSITVKSSATGGTEPYKFHISYKKESSHTYSIVQDFASNKTVTIKPAAATKYNIMIQVKDKTGTIKTKVFVVSVTK